MNYLQESLYKRERENQKGAKLINEERTLFIEQNNKPQMSINQRGELHGI